MATKYIEARPGEKWRDVTRLFTGWLKLNAPALGSFGFSEDDPLEHNGLHYFALSIPDRHGEKVGFFEEWAKTTDRSFGARDNERVTFKDGSSAPAPTHEASPLPAWLK